MFACFMNCDSLKQNFMTHGKDTSLRKTGGPFGSNNMVAEGL